ncbi:hypothetical protein CRI93_12340 [Longimonas halophila]|uniref:CHY-type domain-containing protein n=1 Tax=Longimonas halophila TaxID=1469170 RepID=A0A2H3NJM8_9BACT|nr:CHY zinc finger protein [Longimonas halophila]PEN05690.1 hypothetical protein CRI93_12340 [Longimonas halophila]
MPTNRRTTHPPETDPRFDAPLCGMGVDAETRCAHYATERDVIALRFPCCNVFYPCHACHDAVADHASQQWDAQADLDERAVLCGACRTVLTWRQYLNAEHACPDCGADFNPGCTTHLHLYIRDRTRQAPQ